MLWPVFLRWAWWAVNAGSATLERWGKMLYCLGIEVWCWVIGMLLKVVDNLLLTPLVEFLPSPPTSWDFSPLAGLYATVDLIAPLSEMVFFGTLYGLTWATVMAYRVIKRHVPFVS